MADILIKHLVNVRAWEEVEERNILFAPDARFQERSIENAQIIASGKLIVEDGTNINIPLPDIQTIMGVSFVSDQNLTVSLNGQAGLPLSRPHAGTEEEPTYCTFFWEGPLTSINLAKADDTPDTNANVRWVVWGNPEP